MAFKDPIDEEADAAERSSVDKGLRELEARIKEPTDEVPVEEPDEDNDEPEEQPSRKDRRASRMSARERAAAAEAEARVLREQLDITKRERADRGEPRQQNPVAGIDQRLRSVYAEQEKLHDAWIAKQGKMSAQEEATMKERAMELDVEKNTLIVKRAEAVDEPQRRERNRVAMLQSQFPDVYGNPTAHQYASGEWNRRRALGEPDSKELHDAVMEEARRVILNKRPRPEAADRQRMTGVSSRATSATADRGATIAMPAGSPLYKMAVAAYPDLDPAKACQKWANAKGKAYLQAVSTRR